nr:MAG TPA: hypothetical protein [Caudoviricetes sp.]
MLPNQVNPSESNVYDYREYHKPIYYNNIKFIVIITN